MVHALLPISSKKNPGVYLGAYNVQNNTTDSWKSSLYYTTCKQPGKQRETTDCCLQRETTGVCVVYILPCGWAVHALSWRLYGCCAAGANQA
jgi:hypothetical protein